MTYRPFLSLIKSPMILRGKLNAIQQHIEDAGFQLVSSRLIPFQSSLLPVIGLGRVAGVPPFGVMLIWTSPVQGQEAEDLFTKTCAEVDRLYGSGAYEFTPVAGADDGVYVTTNPDDISMLVQDTLFYDKAVDPIIFPPPETRLVFREMTYIKDQTVQIPGDIDIRMIGKMLATVLDHNLGMANLFQEILKAKTRWDLNELRMVFSEEEERTASVWSVTITSKLECLIQLTSERFCGSAVDILPPTVVGSAQAMAVGLRLGTTSKMIRDIRTVVSPPIPEGTKAQWTGVTFRDVVPTPVHTNR